MDELKAYLKEIGPDRGAELAARCDTSLGHLRNICYGKTCAEKLAIALERESQGRVRCEDLRPDVDWAFLRAGGAVAAQQQAA